LNKNKIKKMKDVIKGFLALIVAIGIPLCIYLYTQKNAEARKSNEHESFLETEAVNNCRDTVEFRLYDASYHFFVLDRKVCEREYSYLLSKLNSLGTLCAKGYITRDEYLEILNAIRRDLNKWVDAEYIHVVNYLPNKK
ncbi:MAG: hypothetical protein FWC41_10900, partial [Firmicutes bacterium]|nr:hypothetical protein [Bacillota bacterium]